MCDLCKLSWQSSKQRARVDISSDRRFSITRKWSWNSMRAKTSPIKSLNITPSHRRHGSLERWEWNAEKKNIVFSPAQFQQIFVCVLAWASMRFQIDDDGDDDEIFRNIYYVQTLNEWTPIEVLPLRPIVVARFHIHFRRWWSRKSGRGEFNAIFVFGCRCCCTHSLGQS